jgi:hypothetical protein
MAGRPWRAPSQAAVHGRDAAGEKVGEGDVDAVGGRAVDGPRGDAEAVIGARGGDGTVAAFAGAGPALLVERGDDEELVAGEAEGGDEGVEEGRADAVVVGN